MTEEELLLIPEINNTFEIYATASESIEQNPERSLKIITSCIDKFQVYQAYNLVSLCKSFLAKCERVMGNYDIAESYCEQGYSLAKSFDFDKGKLFNIIEWSVIKYCRHQLDESTRMSKEAQSLAQKINRPDILRIARENLVSSLLANEEYLECLEVIFTLVEDYEAEDEDLRRQTSYRFLILIYRSLGDNNKAYEYVQKLIPLVQSSPILLLISYLNATLFLRSLNQHQKGLTYLEKAYSIAYQLKDNYNIAVCDRLNAEYYVDMGDYELAKLYLDKSEKSFEELSVRKFVYDTTFIRAYIAYHQSHFQLAIDITIPITNELESLKHRKSLLADCYKLLSDCYIAENSIEQALTFAREYRRIKEMWYEEDCKNLYTLHDIHIKLRENDIKKEKIRISHAQLLEENTKSLQTLAFKIIDHIKSNNIINSVGNTIKSATRGQNINLRVKEQLETLTTSLSIENSLNETWCNFDERFSTIFSDFRVNLFSISSIITLTEFRIATLLKIDLSTKEISSLLCISQRAVEGHRLRLRKKLHLEQKESLVTFLQKI